MSFGATKNFRGTSIPSIQTGMVASAGNNVSEAKRVSDAIRFGDKAAVAAARGPIMASGPATPSMSDAVRSLMPEVDQFTASTRYQTLDSWRQPVGVGPTWSPEHDTREYRVSASQIPQGAGIVSGMMPTGAVGVISSTDVRSKRMGTAPIGYQGDISVHMEALKKQKEEIVKQKEETVTQIQQKMSAVQKIEESITNSKVSGKDAEKLQTVADKNKQEATDLTKKVEKLNTEEKKVDQQIAETVAKQPQPLPQKPLPPIGYKSKPTPFAPHMGVAALERPDPTAIDAPRFTASGVAPYNPSALLSVTGQDTTPPSPSERAGSVFGMAAAHVSAFGSGMKSWFQGFWKKQ